MIGMVVVVVQVRVARDRTASISAVKVVPVAPAVLEHQIQFAAAHKFMAVVVAVVERHRETQEKRMALAGLAEAALAGLVAEVLAPCQQQVLRILDLVAVEAVGETPTLVHNALALQAQTALLSFHIQSLQQVFRVSL
jgi:uncharacterized DUF497 family protein